ncbi:helix-turn-helix transcriptional regulator [Roseburia hominis]
MKNKFHENLTILRKARNYTQAQIADRLDISRSTYANYEAGKRSPDLDMLEKISVVLDVSIDELFGRRPRKMWDVICEDPAPYGTDTDLSIRRASAVKRAILDVPGRNKRKGLAIGEQSFRKMREAELLYG